MQGRNGIGAIALTMLLCVALAPQVSAAPPLGGDQHAATAKKQCKKGFKRVKKNGKTRCRRKQPVATTGLPPVPLLAALAISPSSHFFGNLSSNTQASMTFAVTNGGAGASGTLSQTITGPDAARFVISENTCLGLSLGPAAGCSLKITYTAPSSAPATPLDLATLNVSGSFSGAASAALSANPFD